MADATVEEPEKKSSKLPMIVGLFLALAGGGSGFYAVYSGMVLGGESHAAKDGHVASDKEAHGAGSDAGHGDDHGDGHGADSVAMVGDIAFVPVDPLIISLGSQSANRHLRFRAQLEVPQQHRASVQALMPRVVDVLNSYLRAVETRDLEDPAILLRLRAQMLRRVQIVAGADHVRDLLIMEFVLN